MSLPLVILYDIVNRKYNDISEIPILNIEDIDTILSKKEIIYKVETVADLTRKMLYHFDILHHDVRCAFVIGLRGEPNIAIVRHCKDPTDSTRMLKIAFGTDEIIIKSSTGFNAKVKNVTEFKNNILSRSEFKSQINAVTASLQPSKLVSRAEDLNLEQAKKHIDAMFAKSITRKTYNQQVEELLKLMTI